jgi:phosphatidylinositol alpha-1,6-mannosyltransferase
LTLAARRRWPAELVLVWHLQLLKLIPLLRIGAATRVVFLHGIEAWRRPDGPTRRLLRGVALFLVNSDHTWTRFAAENPDLARIPHRRVPLGIGAPAPASPAPAQPPAVVVLGRMARSEGYKGHRELILAWPRVLARMPEACLWIVGDGDAREDLERLARERGLRDRVRFWGRVGEDDKRDLIVRASCLALPSRGEGFGLAYLEAMRLGRPCLVSTLDAGREVVCPPEAGLAADPDDPPAVADAVVRLATPGAAWDGWAARARRRYEEGFTARAFQERLLAALAGARA